MLFFSFFPTFRFFVQTYAGKSSWAGKSKNECIKKIFQIRQNAKASLKKGSLDDNDSKSV